MSARKMCMVLMPGTAESGPRQAGESSSWRPDLEEVSTSHLGNNGETMLTLATLYIKRKIHDPHRFPVRLAMWVKANPLSFPSPP